MPEKAHQRLHGEEESPSRQRSPMNMGPGLTTRLAAVVAVLVLLAAVPSSANILPENEGMRAWIQEKASVPVPEAGELLQQSLQYQPQVPVYGGVPAMQGAQYGYGAIPQQPPLVTTQTEAKAAVLEPGIVINSLNHRTQIRSAALQRQLAAYKGISPWFFVGSFLATVCTIIVGFFYVKGIWSRMQDEEQGLH